MTKKAIAEGIVGTIMMVAVCVIGSIMQFATIGKDIPFWHIAYEPWMAWSETVFIWVSGAILVSGVWKTVKDGDD